MSHRPPNRRSTRDSFDWITVHVPETSVYSRDRSPQFNNRNKSSNEVASASAKGGGYSPPYPFPNVAGLRIDTTHDADAGMYEDGYMVTHIPPSNSTMETDDTICPANVAAPVRGPPVTSSRPSPSMPSPACPPLTAENVARFNRDNAERCPSSIADWRSAAGHHFRGFHDEAFGLSPAHTDWSTHPASPGRSHAPSSIVGLDSLLLPPAAATQEPERVVIGAGAWTEEEQGPAKGWLSDDEF
ncbi:hypothetical protein VTJ83DRAFT_507 [Remersonia thermophila]|uniref:Uncharacterized protein n=1 Tax=Remersonia thermophila TaxID=72144 RepID=A0ABR4DLJ3_9PEZI